MILFPRASADPSSFMLHPLVHQLTFPPSFRDIVLSFSCSFPLFLVGSVGTCVLSLSDSVFVFEYLTFSSLVFVMNAYGQNCSKRGAQEEGYRFIPSTVCFPAVPRRVCVCDPIDMREVWRCEFRTTEGRAILMQKLLFSLAHRIPCGCPPRQSRIHGGRCLTQDKWGKGRK